MSRRHGDADLDSSDANQSDADARPDADSSPLDLSPRLDVVFVLPIDSLGHYSQESLKSSAPVLFQELLHPTFSEELGAVPRRLESIHIGVIASDMGAGLQPLNTCYDLPYGYEGILFDSPRDPRVEGCEELSSSDCGDEHCPWLSLDADESFEQAMHAFDCITTLGENGCGIEQPFEALRASVVNGSAPDNPNSGFFRDDSVVMFVILNNEDDCSAENTDIYDPENPDYGIFGYRCAFLQEELVPVQAYSEFLRESFSTPQDRVLMGAIAGFPIDGSWDEEDPIEQLYELQEPDPDCTYCLYPVCSHDYWYITPSPRIGELVLEFGERGYLGSTCESDWASIMMGMARTVQRRLMR